MRINLQIYPDTTSPTILQLSDCYRQVPFFIKRHFTFLQTTADGTKSRTYVTVEVSREKADASKTYPAFLISNVNFTPIRFQVDDYISREVTI